MALLPGGSITAESTSALLASFEASAHACPGSVPLVDNVPARLANAAGSSCRDCSAGSIGGGVPAGTGHAPDRTGSAAVEHMGSSDTAVAVLGTTGGTLCVVTGATDGTAVDGAGVGEPRDLRVPAAERGREIGGDPARLRFVRLVPVAPPVRSLFGDDVVVVAGVSAAPASGAVAESPGTCEDTKLSSDASSCSMVPEANVEPRCDGTGPAKTDLAILQRQQTRESTF